jgi:HrpA-like RNA helicase
MAPITLLNKGSLIARMGEKQSELDSQIPINYIMNWFEMQLNQKDKKLTTSDRIVILLSKTGSGKSTSIAPNLYLRFFNKYRKSIIITQPRVLTAIEIPKDISNISDYKKPNKEGLSIELYKNIGYQTQEFVRKTQDRGILFTTTGILLQFLKTMTDEMIIKKYKFIIIDEAHDRSLDVDLILLLMKNLINRNLDKNPPFLILMSATLNVDEYSNYFNTKTIFEVIGQSKPIKIMYPRFEVSNIFISIINIVATIQNNNLETDNIPGDIIIFMPNVSYINKIIRQLQLLNTNINHKFLLLSITSLDISQESNNYKKLILPLKAFDVEINNTKYKPSRKVIVSTNVAETGLTIESLKYCIDTGLLFTAEFNPKYATTMLMIKPVTSSMTLQRKGRVGRKQPGIFYPLFSEDVFNSMSVDNTPSILTEDITEHILNLLLSNDISLIHKLLTIPSDDSITYSLEKLYILGAIDKNIKLTKLGKLMTIFRKISIESRRMILAAITFNTPIKNMVILTCMLNTKRGNIFNEKDRNTEPITTAKIFSRLYHNEITYDIDSYNTLKNKLLIGCEFIDLLLIYYKFSSIVKYYKCNISKIKIWCLENGLNYYGLTQLVSQIDELNWQLIDLIGINPIKIDTDTGYNLYELLKLTNDRTMPDFIEEVIKIKNCIYEGYKMNLLTLNDDGKYINKFNNIIILNSKLIEKLPYQKLGANFEQDRPKLLIYKDLILRKSQMNNIYEYSASTISIMDGYVDIDMYFNES